MYISYDHLLFITVPVGRALCIGEGVNRVSQVRAACSRVAIVSYMYNTSNRAKYRGVSD